MNFGEKVQKIREMKGLKSKFVANKLGVSPARYSQLENNHARITVEMIEKIAKVLDVPAAIFFDKKPSETRNKQSA